MLIYTVSVSGAVVQLHFCDNELESISLNKNSKPKCCCNENLPSQKDKSTKHFSKKSCCNESSITLKLNLDQSSNNSLPQLLSLQSLGSLPIITLPVWQNDFLIQKDSIIPFANAPPEGIWQYIPLYKLHGSFVFYDIENISLS